MISRTMFRLGRKPEPRSELVACHLSLKHEIDQADRLIYEFPGEHTHGETPVPIPNTEAKPVAADGSPTG